MADWLQLLLQIGGLGASVTIAGWVVQHRVGTRIERMKADLTGMLATRARRADYLRDQIRNLYGPLAFLVESNVRRSETANSIMGAYEEYFVGRHGDQAGKEMHEVIDTSNRYIDLIVANNKQAADILRANWGWLDADDIDDTAQYLTDIDRHGVEIEEAKKLPPEFYGMLENSVGKPHFLRGKFVDRVRRKLLEKQRELTGLTGVPPAPDPKPN
jgi:hypothetical protein